MNLFADVVQHHIYRGEDLPFAAGFDYVLAGNGLFKRAENRHVRACLPVVRRQIAGLPPLRAELTPKTGLIPGYLLASVLADAREKAVTQQEQSYLFRAEGGRIRVSRPHQKTSAVRVALWTEAGYDDVVCDLHSHHSMRAYFSDTDDRDETGLRFYAVIGRVLDAPEITVRLGLYGDTFAVPARWLFAELGDISDRWER